MGALEGQVAVLASRGMTVSLNPATAEHLASVPGFTPDLAARAARWWLRSTSTPPLAARFKANACVLGVFWHIARKQQVRDAIEAKRPSLRPRNRAGQQRRRQRLFRCRRDVGAGLGQRLRRRPQGRLALLPACASMHAQRRPKFPEHRLNTCVDDDERHVPRIPPPSRV